MEKKFGDTLKLLMKKEGITPKYFAKELGISYKTLMDWTVAHRMPRDPTILRQIAKYFDCTIEFLLFGEEELISPVESFLQKTEILCGTYEITLKKVSKISSQ